MRVLLYILLSASVVWLAAGLFEAAGTFNAAGHLDLGAAVRDVLSRPFFYGIILLVMHLEASGRSRELVLRLMLLGAFILRAAVAVYVAGTAASDGFTDMLTIIRDISGLIAAAGMLAILVAVNAKKSPLIITLFGMAAMTGALASAYMAVVGMLDGHIGWIEGLAGVLPESLFGVILAVFYGQLRRELTPGN
jgi:hypothetical protein